ncbi:MAG TPA: glyoxalase superfamily protein [Gammaproteobacteria bacterium]|nr:glyoxalase superfamily protein [Gammaproteobacteria bacterium]
MLSIELAKKKANILKKYLNEGGHSISHSSSLHAIALMEGYKNWNTLLVMLQNKTTHDGSCVSKEAKLNEQTKTESSKNQPTISENAWEKITEKAYKEAIAQQAREIQNEECEWYHRQEVRDIEQEYQSYLEQEWRSIEQEQLYESSFQEN